MAALPAPPPVDLVTALQEQLARINAMLFNYLGALQRDAPAQSVKGEALVAPPKNYDVQVWPGPVHAAIRLLLLSRRTELSLSCLLLSSSYSAASAVQQLCIQAAAQAVSSQFPPPCHLTPPPCNRHRPSLWPMT